MLGMFYKINEGRRILRIAPAALVSDISPSDGNCFADSRTTKLVELACENAYINPLLACTRCCYAIRLLHVGPAGSKCVRAGLLAYCLSLGEACSPLRTWLTMHSIV